MRAVMITRAPVAVCLLLALAISAPPRARAEAPDQRTESLVVYYGSEAAIEEFESFSLVVLDDLSHPPLGPLSHRGKTLLGYLSLGEVSNQRAYFKQVEQQGLLLVENPHWPGSFMVDLRDPRWTDRVVEILVPGILQQGFDGIFLDTLDNAAYLESLDPERYQGMVLAATKLVRTIRYHYPGIHIMLNRAFDVLEETAGELNSWLGESMLADADPASGASVLVDARLHADSVERVRRVHQRHEQLELYTLDYWDPADAPGVSRLYQRQRELGFSPYVATLALDRIIQEPSQ